MFSKEELEILSQGVIALIQNTIDAQNLVLTDKAKLALQSEIFNLRILNQKLCDAMEVEQ